MTSAVRGQVYAVDLGGDKGRHFYVIVSANDRNRRLNSVLGLMVTTTNKSQIPSAVQLSHLDPVTGYVVADHIEELWGDELGSLSGAMSRQTMTAINSALKIAFAIPN